MRKCEKMVLVKLSLQNKERLEKDKKYFEKTIGGGKWSLNDAFTEYLKIINTTMKKRVEKK